MALSFGETKGKAGRDKLDNYKMVEGINNVRLVGDIVARYVYWIKGKNDKSIPFECLAFDRKQETFNNLEKDWVPEFFPELKCQWAYVSQAIVNGKIMLFNHKSKLFQQILSTVEDLGDPTDPVDGWDFVFERKKTGPQMFNVEYNILPLKCKKRPLTDSELELVKGMSSIDDILPRPTPESQRKLLLEVTGKGTEDPSETMAEDIVDEFKKPSEDSDFEDDADF